MDLRSAVYNPYNLYGLRNASSECKRSPIESGDNIRVKRLIERLNPSFESSIQTRNREQQEVKLAHYMHDSPILKQAAFNFGASIKELFEVAYPENAQEKIEEAFKFYRENQSGAVNLEDNFFLKPPKVPKPLEVPKDATLRVLVSSLAQTVAIGENKVFLRMLKKIEDETMLDQKDSKQETLKRKYANLVDIDLFSGLGKACGRDDEGLPDIEGKRVKLYKESEHIAVRAYMPLEYPQKCSVKDLNLIPSELRYIQENQGLAKDISPDEKAIEIKRGMDLYVINPNTEFLEEAKRNHYPVVAGPSGSAVHMIIALNLLAPSIKRKMGMQKIHGTENGSEKSAKKTALFDENYYWETYLEMLMVYMKFNGHHSMTEVQQGCEYAHQIMAAYDKPNSEFRFEEINKKIFEKMLAKSKSVEMRNRSVSIA